MINPAAIPQIAGNMDTLAAHAETVKAVGRDFASTGQSVDTTWQGLAAVYRAPEAAQLFAATNPVRTVSEFVGEDLQTVGTALATYAEEVRRIKAELATLRGMATDFVESVRDDEDWHGDEAKVDRHNAILRGVNIHVAAFQDAERRCANTINALYGGRQYRTENGDGQVAVDEYGYPADVLNAAAGHEGNLPWGSTEKADRGILGDIGAYFGGFGEGAVNMLIGLGALFGRNPVNGEWSWGAAGDAWKGLGKFALALIVYNPFGTPFIVMDLTTGLPFLERGELGRTYLDAAKGIVAWDTWGEDPARAAGMTTFNVVSIVVGTKGAGGSLRGAGAALEGVGEAGAAARFGGLLVRAGTRIDDLPRAGEVAARVAAKFDLRIPGFGTYADDFTGHLDNLLTRDDLPAGLANQAARDLLDLQRSGRLAGTAHEQANSLANALRELNGDAANARGAAAELRAAVNVIDSGQLAPNSRVAINATGEVDLGNGTRVNLGDVPEADLVYQTADGVVHLDEVKTSANVEASKLEHSPQQLDRMLDWRNAAPGRQVGVRVDTDEGWTGLFGQVDKASGEMAIERLANADVPVSVGGRTSARRNSTRCVRRWSVPLSIRDTR